MFIREFISDQMLSWENSFQFSPFTPPLLPKVFIFQAIIITEWALSLDDFLFFFVWFVSLDSVSKILFAILGHNYKRKIHQLLLEWPNYKSRVPIIFQKWEKSGHFSIMMKIELSIAIVLCCIYQTSALSEIVNWLLFNYNSVAVLPIAEFFLQAPV